jgi:hypothetical protein
LAPSKSYLLPEGEELVNVSIHPAAAKIKERRYGWGREYVKGTEDMI